jgi:hypothetical protein
MGQADEAIIRLMTGTGQPAPGILAMAAQH